MQKGAAMACSRLTTVMPSRGRGWLGGDCWVGLVEVNGLENGRGRDRAGRNRQVGLLVWHEVM